MFNSKTTINIALLGFGTVGQGVVDILHKNKAHLEEKCGKKLEIAGIAVRNLEKKRDIDLPKSLFTTESEKLATRDDVDVVFELMGGIEPAKTCVLHALQAGKPVVTANKALLAEYGEEIFTCARENNLPVGYEASVAAAVPVIRFLRDGLASSQINEIEGILNGTTNFILSQMQEKGQSYEEAFNLADSLGYLEADPSLDVDGWDAAHKLVILASIAFKKYARLADVMREGIAQVTPADIATAKSSGKVIKLVASARKVEESDNAGTTSGFVEQSRVVRNRCRHERSAPSRRPRWRFFRTGSGSRCTANGLGSALRFGGDATQC